MQNFDEIEVLQLLLADGVPDPRRALELALCGGVRV